MAAFVWDEGVLLVDDGSVIVAHDNVRRRMSVDGFIEVFDRKEWDERFPGSFVTSDHVVEEAYRAATSRK